MVTAAMATMPAPGMGTARGRETWLPRHGLVNSCNGHAIQAVAERAILSLLVAGVGPAAAVPAAGARLDTGIRRGVLFYGPAPDRGEHPPVWFPRRWPDAVTPRTPRARPPQNSDRLLDFLEAL